MSNDTINDNRDSIRAFQLGGANSSYSYESSVVPSATYYTPRKAVLIIFVVTTGSGGIRSLTIDAPTISSSGDAGVLIRLARAQFWEKSLDSEPQC